MKAPKLLDNKKSGLVYKELQDSIKEGSKLSVISAYFTMYAYYELKNELNKIDSMRFIFKKPSFTKKKNEEMREYYINNDSGEKGIFGNEFEIKLRNEMKQGSVAKECSNWIKEKVEIKSFKTSDSSQPRMLYVENDNGEDISINGSVDFTTDGLGLTHSNRSDINMCTYGKEITFPNLMLFNELWENNNLEDVKDQFLEQMQVIYKENPGEFVYFVSMYNIFTDYLDELREDNVVKEGTKFKETNIWNKLYKFQKDAVIGAIDKIEKHNGCIIADSVGLGKTFTALAIIKYYELRNDRVLVLVPKKLRDNWTVYTQNDKRNIFIKDRFGYDVLNHTDLSRQSGYSGEINLQTINWENYDLVVIDESHNFRNNPARKDIKTRYKKLMDDIIKSGVETKVLMLSATPVNNRMRDIRNQISFITEEKDDALENIGIDSIEFTLKKAQEVFNKWSKFEEEYRTSERFVDMMDLDYFKLLDTLTIARSRRHIEKYYSMDEIGKFPERKTPINEYPDIDTENIFPPIKDINSEIKRLNLGIYTPMIYILPQKRKDYENKYDTVLGKYNKRFKQEDRERQLVKLMRINLLKRMESSIHSFKLTISKILYKIEVVLDKINSGSIDFDSNIDINLIDPEEEEYDDMMFGTKNKVLLKDIDLIKWKADLELDKEKLQTILNEAKKINPKRDEKLQRLKEIIVEKIKNPLNKNNKKIIIFTAFSDTAQYLYENIHKWALEELNLHSAIVTGSENNKTTFKFLKSKDINDILTNFSPISKERNRIYGDVEEEIDILIGTDCISEGQNLQDCDYLINYDIHWNPVRIIQRFGRIDRIGSRNEVIQLVNFWPNMDLDEYIDLTSRVESRMVMVDTTATGDENIIEDENQIKNEVSYREKQLECLQEEIVDLEDISGGISITDLTFNDFKVELMEYMKEHRKELEEAPSGIYSIVEIDKEFREELNPGIIFLLKQTKGKTESKDYNPLAPFYLGYVNDEKEVELNYIHSKRIMDFYKNLCAGKREVFKELVASFNKETKDGAKMDKYSDFLKIAIENILGKKQETGINSLFKKGGTNPVKNDVIGLDEFELVTFLILK
ncbi:helicase-related protein [Methanobrevibacter curvatus]|uniref:RNA polymerase-associated protein RapA n=1 Tax=Methanobrevibacter curvatus TaxID=49547 RepID=A0A166CS67_9EURY|nr:helicase-related protein [Methanobrevibacter curvatus]KZX16417.1 RNA polymerase-associated protein RapA [Methanobrevibacter curvatus]